MNTARLTELILNLGQVIEQNRDYLTDLDRAIGDADHGINMTKGFRAVADKLQAVAPADPAAAMKTVGMTLISTVGGASGPLYGTAFLRAAAAVAGKADLGRDDLLTVVEAALGGIKERGKAELGDKTSVDALQPAAEAIRSGLQSGAPTAEVARQAAAAARKGAEGTKEYAARKGRASYLGERSIGHQDPGATSTTLMLEALASFLEG